MFKNDILGTILTILIIVIITFLLFKKLNSSNILEGFDIGNVVSKAEGTISSKMKEGTDSVKKNVENVKKNYTQDETKAVSQIITDLKNNNENLKDVLQLPTKKSDFQNMLAELEHVVINQILKLTKDVSTMYTNTKSFNQSQIDIIEKIITLNKFRKSLDNTYNSM